MRYAPLVVVAVAMAALSCAPSESSSERHQDANTPAGKAGQVAHKASVQLDKAGRVVGRKLEKAAHDAHEGWSEDAHRAKSSAPK